MQHLKIILIFFFTGLVSKPVTGIEPFETSAINESMIFQGRNRVEQVLIHLRNIPGGSQVYPGSNGVVKLERWRYRNQAQTLDAMATFYNVRANRGYTVRGYHQSPNDAFDNPEELWGIWKNVEINTKQNEFTFVRNMPYIRDVQTSYRQRQTANPSLEKGEEVVFNILMHNPAPRDFRGKVVLMLKNTNTGNIHRIERDIILAAGGHRESAPVYFTAHEAGEYHMAAGIFVGQRINQWTDCWDWSENPVLFVTAEHRSLSFAGYQWDVKAGFGNPGANLWSNSSEDVWVDQSGRLHLSLKKKPNGRWYATEVISPNCL